MKHKGRIAVVVLTLGVSLAAAWAQAQNPTGVGTSRRSTIAVLHFRVVPRQIADPESLAQTLDNAVSTEIFRQRGSQFQAVERQHIEGIIRELKISLGDLTNP